MNGVSQKQLRFTLLYTLHMLMDYTLFVSHNIEITITIIIIILLSYHTVVSRILSRSFVKFSILLHSKVLCRLYQCEIEFPVGP